MLWLDCFNLKTLLRLASGLFCGAKEELDLKEWIVIELSINLKSVNNSLERNLLVP